MRHSQADKLATHQRIVQVAARRFRERGIDGISVGDIMKEAGLTVGGFYKHFESRDALVTEAFILALQDIEQIQDALRAEHAEYPQDVTLEHVVAKEAAGSRTVPMSERSSKPI